MHNLRRRSVVTEICLLTKTKRVASVRADTYCSLFTLSVEHLDKVLERYPQVRQILEEVADERLRQLRDSNCVAGPSISSRQRRQLRRMVREDSVAPYSYRPAHETPSTPATPRAASIQPTIY